MLIWFSFIALLNLYISEKTTLIILLFVGITAAAIGTYVVMKRGQKHGKYRKLLFFPKQHPMEDIFRFMFSRNVT
jgi:hypothetical protein